ncbi:MAG: tyrosine--tRNA ligase [Myxococcales bacterium]|nr:tyrosine--tRNA ligase [Myxococcales bacterium]
MATTILEELQARGLVQATTNDEELGKALIESGIPFYAGFDPTSASLHIGSLVPITLLARLQKAGHKPIILVGGATGMIGDPSGRSDERSLLSDEALAANLAGIQKQLEPFVHFDDSPAGAIVLNNATWFDPIGFIAFLRDVGKHMTVNYMTAKDSVKSRLNDREQGISYTEFSYMLLQAYDYVHLAREHACRLQVGGSDQWGNITAGIELARKMGVKESLYGLTAPLLLDSKGQKMGKTAGGTRMWLDPEKTSPYAFYQYWLNTEDGDVERFLKLFSWRPLDEIAEICKQHDEEPHRRVGQKTIAEDMTTWVHGADALGRAIAASQVMFGGSLEKLGDADLSPLLAELPSTTLSKSELDKGIELTELLHTTALAKSKGEARRLISGGGVYINNIREHDAAKRVDLDDLGTETMLVLRSGKKKYHIVHVS